MANLDLLSYESLFSRKMIHGKCLFFISKAKQIIICSRFFQLLVQINSNNVWGGLVKGKQTKPLKLLFKFILTQQGKRYCKPQCAFSQNSIVTCNQGFRTAVKWWYWLNNTFFVTSYLHNFLSSVAFAIKKIHLETLE